MNTPYEQEIFYRLLKILSKDSNLSQREMSRCMGISLGKVNYCLSEFAKKGMIKIHHFKDSKSKGQYIYLLTRKGMEEKARLTLDFFRRKVREYEEIKEHIRELAMELDEKEREGISSEDVLKVLKGVS